MQGSLIDIVIVQGTETMSFNIMSSNPSLQQDFPNTTAFALLAGKEFLFLQHFGQSLDRSFGFSDISRNHFLGRIRIFFQEIQQRGFLQSAIFALWSCTLGEVFGFPVDIKKTVFEFIFPLKEQVFKESLQKYGGRGNLLGVVDVIGPHKRIAEIPGVPLERLVVGQKSEFAQIEDSKNCGRSGVPLHERVYLPQPGNEFAGMLYRLLSRQGSSGMKMYMEHNLFS